ncbi:MAG: peptidoglycan-binding protein [Verrucomicrobia bacterium]|nr:peptidoglycan-binding protein [Verrucomicrobiota bacterium]
MKLFALLMVALLVTSEAHAFILDEEVFSQKSYDSLAPRDEYGPLHQGKAFNSTDLAPRYHVRFPYYFKAPEQLILEPAYVGALQRDLHRLGYYCGPIDGFFSVEVSDAIAHLQKNYSMRVTGTLTDPVRRALHLP